MSNHNISSLILNGKLEHDPAYQVDIDFDKVEQRFSFSIVERAVSLLDKNLKHGLCGEIKIVDGLPQVSIGLRNEQHVFEVVSNGLDSVSCHYDDEVTMFKTHNYQDDIVKARSLIADKDIRFGLGLSDDAVTQWYVSKNENELVSTYICPNNGEHCLAIVTFSDFNIGCIEDIKFKRNVDVARVLPDHLSDQALLELISSNEKINQRISGNVGGALWDKDSVTQVVFELMNMSLESVSNDFMISLIAYFNSYCESTGTMRCGNTLYHVALDMAHVLSLTDKELFAALDMEFDFNKVAQLRKKLVNNYVNGSEFVISEKCNHKNSKGQCLGHSIDKE